MGENRSIEEEIKFYQEGNRLTEEAGEEILSIIKRATKKFQRIIPPGDPDDVEGEALIYVLKGIDTFEHRSEFSTWVHTVTRNRALISKRKWDTYTNKHGKKTVSRRKRHKKNFERTKELQHDLYKETLAKAFEKEKRPVDEMEIVVGVYQNAEEDKRKHERALLGRFLGMEQNELSRALDTSPGAIRVNVHRGRTYIKKHDLRDRDKRQHYGTIGRKIIYRRIQAITSVSTITQHPLHRETLYTQAKFRPEDMLVWDHLLLTASNTKNPKKVIAACMQTTQKYVKEVLDRTTPLLAGVIE